jgi:hypothetical protein
MIVVTGAYGLLVLSTGRLNAMGQELVLVDDLTDQKSNQS